MNAKSHQHHGARAAGDLAVTSARPASPEAVRASPGTWKDPRLLVGVVIVAVCILLGARLLASADDSVTVWAAADDLTAGTTVTVDLLEPRKVRFSSEALAGRYLSSGHGLPGDAVLTRDVTAGELLPRAALGAGKDMDLVEVPIALAGDAVPAGLRAGEVVDVWVTPAAESGDAPRAVRVLRQVRVMAVPHIGSAFGPATSRQVVVGVPAGDDGLLAAALAQVSTGQPVLVRRG